MAGKTGRRGTDLTGRRFGRLTACERTEQRDHGYIIWHCRCDCGGEIDVSSKRLQRGVIQDCGCVTKTSARGKAQAEDLTGKSFGRLTVIRRAKNRHGRICWLCRCECGNEKEITAHDLKAGKVKSCGCLKYEREYTRVDISGRQFGRLTALYPTERRDKHGTVYWHCRCSCGNEAEVSESSLMSGNCKSCGCLKKENQKNISKQLHMVDGTCVEFLEKRKHRRDNKSGFRGVYQLKNGKFRVSIGFRGKRISLGTFEKYEDAVETRLAAEDKIYGGFLEQYKKWEKKAADDPGWAESNPFCLELPHHHSEQNEAGGS